MRSKFIDEVQVIAKKEVLEISNSIKKLSVLFILPFATIFFIAKEGGASGVFAVEFNVIISQLFAGLFGIILIKDSITREIRQRTLEVLLTSRISLKNIIVGKIIPIVIISFFAQIVQTVFLIFVLKQYNSEFLNYITLQTFILIPFIVYLMGAVTLIFSIIINDEKISDIVALLLSFALGIFTINIAYQIGALFNWLILLILCIFIVFINSLITKFCSYILIKSMIFVKG